MKPRYGAMNNGSADSLGRPRVLPLADDHSLDVALAEGHLSVLLLTYVHLTHDESMLDRFAPHLKSAIQQRPEDVPRALAAELRARLRDVLVGRVPVADEPPTTALY